MVNGVKAFWAAKDFFIFFIFVVPQVATGTNWQESWVSGPTSSSLNTSMKPMHELFLRFPPVTTGATRSTMDFNLESCWIFHSSASRLRYGCAGLLVTALQPAWCPGANTLAIRQVFNKSLTPAFYLNHLFWGKNELQLCRNHPSPVVIVRFVSYFAELLAELLCGCHTRQVCSRLGLRWCGF